LGSTTKLSQLTPHTWDFAMSSRCGSSTSRHEVACHVTPLNLACSTLRQGLGDEYSNGHLKA
jgi:hypothetical protein